MFKIIRLHEIRKERGLTQVELAKILGVNQSSISMLESGNRDPSFKLLLRMSERLCVPIEELIKKAS